MPANMIVFLYGKDGYRLKQNLDKIIEEYVKKYAGGMSFAILDAEEESPRDLSAKLNDLVKTTSFFNEKRLIVIKNPFLISKELATLIGRWGLAEDKERILVCAEHQNENELNKKDKNLRVLLSAKPSVVKNFEPLSDKQLETWIAKKAAARNAKIEPAAIKKLILLTDSNSWQIGQEINKLAGYTLSSGGTITEPDVNLLVAPKEDSNIFQVVDAAANKNRLRSAKLLHDHLESGGDPYYIFSMIIYQFRNLLRVKSLLNRSAGGAIPYSSLAKKTGLNPFVLKKTYDQCKKYDLEELKKLFGKLAGMDISAKNGETDIVDCLYQFVLAL